MSFLYAYEDERGNQRNSESGKTWGVSSTLQDVAAHYSSTGLKKGTNLSHPL